MPTPTVDCGLWATVRDWFDPRITNSTYLADAYQCAQYSEIPLPVVPTPRAPQTPEEMAIWTQAQATNDGSDWAKATDAAIAAAEANGTYTPAGNLPVTATWLDTYKVPLILAGSALLLLIVAEELRA